MKLEMIGRLNIQTIQLKHYSKKIFSSVSKKGLAFIAALFLFTTPSYAINYFANDFRMDVNTTKFITLLDLKSDKLALNTFDKEWKIAPQHNKRNHAFGNNYYAFI